MSCRRSSGTFDDWSVALDPACGLHASVEQARSTDTRPDGTGDAASGIREVSSVNVQMSCCAVPAVGALVCRKAF